MKQGGGGGYLIYHSYFYHSYFSFIKDGYSITVALCVYRLHVHVGMSWSRQVQARHPINPVEDSCLYIHIEQQ